MLASLKNLVDMEFLSMFSPQRQLLGLDIGSSSIKLVQIKEHRGHYTLQKFGIKELEPEVIVDGTVMDEGRVVSAIKELLAEKNVKLKAQVKSAMIYPIAVIVIAGLVVGVILWKVIPTFAQLFAGLGAELCDRLDMVDVIGRGARRPGGQARVDRSVNEVVLVPDVVAAPAQQRIELGERRAQLGGIVDIEPPDAHQHVGHRAAQRLVDRGVDVEAVVDLRGGSRGRAGAGFKGRVHGEFPRVYEWVTSKGAWLSASSA